MEVILFMDERKRIMDLVKKGIITSEEAIVLLEKLGQENAEEVNEDNSQASNEKNNTYRKQNDASSDYIANLKKRINQIEERLTVLNTLDDFERLDDDEAVERDELNKSLSELKSELTKAELEKRNYEKSFNNQNNKFFGFDSSDIEDGARDFASRIKDSVKNFSNNFEFQDFNIKIPSFVRTKKIETSFEYDPTEINVLNLKNFNGNVTIKQGNDQKIHEIVTYRVYGNIHNSSPEEFFEENTINQLNGATLNIKLHRRIAADIQLIFPHDFKLASARLRCKNGSFKLSDLEITDLIIVATNGSITFNNFNVDHAEVNNVNGSISVNYSWLKSGILSTTNGSIRTYNSCTNLEVSNVNGSIILSNISSKTTNIDAHLVNGNVKISIPKELGYKIIADTKNGSINHRLSDADIIEHDKHYKSVKINHNGSGDAKFQISTISGSVYLKDSSLEGVN